jgi:hypothetical protein
MKKLLIFTAIAEALTGLILLVYPPIIFSLLFGAEITGAGIVVSRIAGISLLALATACWPDAMAHRALYGMMTYNILATLYFIYVGVSGEVGILLWPAVAVHAGLSILLVLAWWKVRPDRETKT